LPHVKLVHLRDATLEHLQVPAGTGLVDFGWLVDRLHAINYDGQFAIKYVDCVPTIVVGEDTGDVSENVIRMRDVFVAAERAQGIVRAATPAASPL
jgi:sugar phosphate isomerase/epimerase